MSGEVGSSGGTGGDEEDRKGKRTKYSDDDKKQTGEQNPSSVPSGLNDDDLYIFDMFSDMDGTSLDELTKQQQQAFQHLVEVNNPSSVPSGLNDDDLSVFHTFSEMDGTSLDELTKQQQQAFERLVEVNNPFQKLAKGESPQEAFQRLDQVNNPLQKSAKGESPQEDSDRDAQIGNYVNYSTDSDAKKEDLGPVEELFFEIEISDRNCLVIPYATASNHFPPMVIQPNTEETIQLYDPLGRKWTMTLIYDSEAHAYVITNGLNDYIEHNRLNPPDAIRVYLPVPQLHINDFFIQHRKRLGASLFDVLVPRSNRLPIPCEVAENYFNPSEAPCPPHHLNEFPLHITDYLNRTWQMRYVCFEDQEAYVIVRGWEQYVAHHHLNHNDKLRFFRKNPNSGRNRFTVYHELRRRDGSITSGNIKPLLFRWENSFFTKPLSISEVTFGRMEMPGVRLPSGYREQEMVKLTDVNNKDWYVIIKYSKDSREYMIFDGWEGIVEEHKLEVGDMVRLYEPVDSDNETHFLIAFVKKKKTEKEEGGSGSGKPDDGAGPSSVASFLNLRKKSHMSATVPETPLHHFFSQFEN